MRPFEWLPSAGSDTKCNLVIRITLRAASGYGNKS